MPAIWSLQSIRTLKPSRVVHRLKMPECQAFGCVNRRGEKGAGKGKRYFVIPDGNKYPEKRELSQRWLHNIGTGHTVDKFTFGKHKVVCEDHFRPECFEEDLRARLMGETPRKILKPDAVPEVFVHRTPREDAARSNRALKRSLKNIQANMTDCTKVCSNHVLSLAEKTRADLSSHAALGIQAKDVASLLDPPKEWFDNTTPCMSGTPPPLKKKTTEQSVLSRQMMPDVASLLDLPQEWFDSPTPCISGTPPPSKKKTTEQSVLSRQMMPTLITTPSCNVATQTDNSFQHTVDVETQTTGPNVMVNLTAVDHDHVYAVPRPQGQSSVPLPIDVPLPALHAEHIETPTCNEPSMSTSDLGEMDSLAKDPTYFPDDDDDEIDEMSEEFPEETPFPEKAVKDDKYIVFGSCLDKLFYKITCDECHCSVETIRKGVVGTGLFITLQCISGHEVMKWASQPLEGKMPVGNLLTAASIMYSGLTYQRISSFANLLNLKLFSPTLFFNIQRQYLVPEINSAWVKDQSSLISSLQGKPLSIVGDGRCDSPGYSAKYCSYTLMDIESEKVVDFELVQVSETTSSVKMEAVGFSRCFSRVLNDHKLSIEKFASDRHVSIRKLMKDNHKGVKHNFDVFHLAKNISSKLRKIAKKKGNEDIECWIKSINNHVWYCSRNCGKDPSLLIEMWMSLSHHITGKHSWHDDERFKTFKECCHQPIDPEINRRKKWLVEGSSAHNALNKIILSKRLLNDLKYLAEFMHTGALEVYHNVVLKYAPKRLEFDYPYMSARLKLAAMDHNHNVGRAQAIVQQPRKGSTAKGELQFKKSYSKIQKQWVLKPIYEKKSYQYLSTMMAGVIKRKQEQRIEAIEQAPAPNIAPVPAPEKEEMVAQHSSRF